MGEDVVEDVRRYTCAFTHGEHAHCIQRWPARAQPAHEHARKRIQVRAYLPTLVLKQPAHSSVVSSWGGPVSGACVSRGCDEAHPSLGDDLCRLLRDTGGTLGRLSWKQDSHAAPREAHPMGLQALHEYAKQDRRARRFRRAAVSPSLVRTVAPRST